MILGLRAVKGEEFGMEAAKRSRESDTRGMMTAHEFCGIGDNFDASAFFEALIFGDFRRSVGEVKVKTIM
jgi:hypothetical protein